MGSVYTKYRENEILTGYSKLTNAPLPAKGTEPFQVATTIQVPWKEERFCSDLTRFETLSSIESEVPLCPATCVSYQTSPNVLPSISLQ